MTTVPITSDDVETIRSMMLALVEHYELVAGDDPPALDELLRDASELLGRVEAVFPPLPDVKAIDWTDVPL